MRKRHTTFPRRIAAAFIGVVASLFVISASASTLSISVEPRWSGKTLQFDSLTNQTQAGQMVSVTRLDFLLSNFSLRRTNGSWLTLSNQFAFISAREGKTSFALNDLPAGKFEKIRFNIGLSQEMNHKDPAKFPAAHPLNPLVNGLHWGWMGGYVFLALEGDWLDENGKQSGYSYHLANDVNLMTVELPVPLELSSNRLLKLAFNVDTIFEWPHRIKINSFNATTHSRTNDLIARHLRRYVERAFTVERAEAASAAAEEKTTVRTSEVLIAAGATPYRFEMSAAFPIPDLPKDNPLTEQGVALGRKLFFEPRLSINNAQSCASCHDANRAFAENKRVSVGAEGIAGTRNAMSLVNLAWKTSFFWDGRAASLREQVLQPIENAVEMHESLSNVVEKLSVISGKRIERGNNNYPEMFALAFGSEEITADRIARALEQFLLAQVSFGSKFDRVLLGAEKFSEDEQRGFELFHTEYDPRRGQFGADCFHCHGGPLFQSQTFANNGLDREFSDPGRFNVTQKSGDAGKFSVPTLRNVELTAPYMHDGRFATLEQVIVHYSTGIKRSATLDPNLTKHPDGGLSLSVSDQRALVAFLKTLTDDASHSRPATDFIPSLAATAP